MTPVLAGFDLGMTITGWTVGDGASMPEVGHWKFDGCGRNLGQLGDMFLRNLHTLHRRTGFTHVHAEEQILVRYRDKVLTLRKMYGLGMALQQFCFTRGIPFQEHGIAKLKRALAGDPKAEKADMIRVARKIGVPLPPGAEAEDVADSFAAWYIGVGIDAKPHLQAWHRKIWGPGRGGLL